MESPERTALSRRHAAGPRRARPARATAPPRPAGSHRRRRAARAHGRGGSPGVRRGRYPQRPLGVRRGAFKGAGTARAPATQAPPPQARPRLAPSPAPGPSLSGHCWAAGGTPRAARAGGSVPGCGAGNCLDAESGTPAAASPLPGVRGWGRRPGLWPPCAGRRFLLLAPPGPGPGPGPRSPPRPPAGRAPRAPLGCPGKLARGAPGMRHHHVPPGLVAR